MMWISNKDPSAHLTNSFYKKFLKHRQILRTRKSALEKRRTSHGFKKKQFLLRQSKLKEWRKGLKARREARSQKQEMKEDRENFLPLFTNKRKRKASTPLDCPLDTCPKKLRLITQLRRLEANTDESSDDTFSIITQMSIRSARSRTPLKIIRRN